MQNAKVMAETIISNGIDVVSNGTQNHIVLVDLRNKNITGKDLEKVLGSINITVNKNGIPNDPRSFVETSGIRIGTAAETTRGHGADWFRDLAKKIVESGGVVKTFIPPTKNSKSHGHFNPSIINDRGSLHIISRECNYVWLILHQLINRYI